MRTAVTIHPDETLWVETHDPDIPDVRINFDGSHPAVECPWDRCDAMIRLQGFYNPKPDGSSYPAHYLTEHLLPQISEGEELPKSEAREDFSADPERYGP